MLAVVADELVVLCPCWDLAEAQAIRASLAARGVRVLIEGEHQRGILGMMGTAISLRVMVPRSQLSLARELASEIIPGLADEEALDADEELLSQPASPARRDLGPDPLEVTSEDDDPEQWDEPEGDEGDEVLAPREAPRKKSIAIALVLGGLGLAVGTLHIYVGKRWTGIALLVLAAIAFFLIMLGKPQANQLLLCVWGFDIVRGLILIHRHNAAIDEQARKARLMRLN